ncbi:MAG: hypothetical protein H6592_08540 [Flavobacteriales bacterium]|nr:hypothetical protein [Flavobacteriales bacterium]HPF89059.1 hypothetical protein [Flavobacteriales bacterium]
MRNMLSPSLFVRSALLVCAVAGGLSASAQCRSFAKNKCVPELAPYKFNETFNAAQLAPGEEAEVNLTFYSGQEYRVMVCTHPILGEVNWKLVDENNKIVFESLADEPKKFFDLKAGSTVPMKVVVWVPNKGSSSMVHVGCVAIMVGFKE